MLANEKNKTEQPVRDLCGLPEKNNGGLRLATSGRHMGVRAVLSGDQVSPRLISRKEAARYCGLSVNSFKTFSEKVLKIHPIWAGHRRLYDLRTLDSAIDELQGWSQRGITWHRSK